MAFFYHIIHLVTMVVFLAGLMPSDKM